MSGAIEDPNEWLAVLCLRIAVLIHRRRTDLDVSKLKLSRNGRGFALHADPAWLEGHPLTEFSLRQEWRVGPDRDSVRTGLPPARYTRSGSNTERSVHSLLPSRERRTSHHAAAS